MLDRYRFAAVRDVTDQLLYQKYCINFRPTFTVLAYSTQHITKNMEDHPLLSITDCLFVTIKPKLIYNTMKQCHSLSLKLSAIPSHLQGQN
jgi:hypothetical protein